MNTHFLNGTANELAITHVSMLCASNSGDDASFAIGVFHRVEPIGKCRGSFKFDHVEIVFLGIQTDKPLFS
jgi:hypothetical protein